MCIRDRSLLVGIGKRNQVRNDPIVPGVAVLFRQTAAAFVESCVADLAVVLQDLVRGCLCCLRDGSRIGLGDSLIALAVIVSADVEVAMRFSSVPSGDLVAFHHRNIAGAHALWIELWKAQPASVSYTHLRAHETPEHLVC